MSLIVGDCPPLLTISLAHGHAPLGARRHRLAVPSKIDTWAGAINSGNMDDTQRTYTGVIHSGHIGC